MLLAKETALLATPVPALAPAEVIELTASLATLVAAETKLLAIPVPKLAAADVRELNDDSMLIWGSRLPYCASYPWLRALAFATASRASISAATTAAS